MILWSLSASTIRADAIVFALEERKGYMLSRERNSSTGALRGAKTLENPRQCRTFNFQCGLGVGAKLFSIEMYLRQTTGVGCEGRLTCGGNRRRLISFAPLRPHTDTAIFTASATKNTTKIRRNTTTGKRCASFAPSGAMRKLVIAIPANAGR